MTSQTDSLGPHKLYMFVLYNHCNNADQRRCMLGGNPCGKNRPSTS